MPIENNQAKPLKVERPTVTKLMITGAPRLDAITVFLEDLGRRDCSTESNPNYQTAQGKITINCWENSWNAYRGGMSSRTVAEFVADCGWDYEWLGSRHQLHCFQRRRAVRPGKEVHRPASAAADRASR
uniref:hypothetical protein n=1 Tax=Pseudomonas mohnii TaxID=395600 RepID=UPI001F559827|nr:hypothetical protein [Pseudomonas mohnii]